MILDPQISEWDNPTASGGHPHKCAEANRGNLNILVPRGKENNHDSPSSGERTGKSPNRRCSDAAAG